MSWLSTRRVLVTGGAGFLGGHVVERLRRDGVTEIFIPRRSQYDLRRMEDVLRLYDDAHPQVVLHLAARVGGIGYSREHPGELLYDNLIMGAQTLEVARQRDVEKFIAIGSVCAYPKILPLPFREEDLWNGYPEETNAPYGNAKRLLMEQALVYKQQYGLNTVSLVLANLYGPGDNFDPASSHVIPSLIHKAIEARQAGKASLEVWGSGTASREFLYASDAAEAIVLAAERYDDPLPVNVGSGVEVTIRELAGRISELTGFQGQLAWQPEMPDGQPRRRIDTTKAERGFGFRASTPLDVGLQRTIDWYRQMSEGKTALGERAR